MGRRYIDEARGRVELVRLAFERALWATVVREAQECVELFLKGALRLVAVEPAHTHDVAECLRREERRFPEWFASQVDYLAAISTEMAGDRGLAYYGDEREQIGPSDLFDESDAVRALRNLDFVSSLCARLVEGSSSSADK
jgi:HEPN domain-containing protein